MPAPRGAGAGPRYARACAGNGAELVEPFASSEAREDSADGARAREPTLRRRTSKGNKAHGRTGRLAAGNGRAGVTDPTAEESLEVESSIGQGIETRNWQRNREERRRRIGGNGKGATATAMWCGCGRGEFFEGCEVRRGECAGSPGRACLVQARPGSSVTGNTANLMIGSGMQQARILRAEETVEVVRDHADGTNREQESSGSKCAATHAGVDARQGRWRGGI